MMADIIIKHCSESNVTYYDSVLGFKLVVPEWEAVITSAVLVLIILVTLIGNILVILSVFTHRPLRTVQNFFLVSLAAADLTVAVLVMPISVIDQMLGRWEFGNIVCKIWLTSDVLCCTASILNLCAIALDRYWAITDPLKYAQKRTLTHVLSMIGAVWFLSAIISSPPVLGWNDWHANSTRCELTKRQGYIVYSSLGSFYIPMFIMSIVYVEIFIATKRRLRERARASKLSVVKWNQPAREEDSGSSDVNQDNYYAGGDSPKNGKRRRTKKSRLGGLGSLRNKYFKKRTISFDDSVTSNPETPPVVNTPTSKVATSSLESPGPRSPSAPPSANSNAKKRAAAKTVAQASKRISLSKERRAARTLGIIMGVFVVCWLPFFLNYVIEPFCETCCPSTKLINFLTWLGYINSALNPVIYTIFNMDFRRAFKKLLHLSP